MAIPARSQSMATAMDVEAMTAAQSGATHLDWRAIIAGAMAAAAISTLLLGFGSAAGLSATSARPFAASPTLLVAVLIAIWMAIVHVGSFAVGGYLAGRLRAPATAVKSENEFRDGVHGFLVWALGTLVGAYLIFAGLSSVAKSTLDAAGTAMTVAGRASIGTADPLAYAADMLLRRPVAANTAAGSAAVAGSGSRDETTPAEIGRILIMDVAGAITPADRSYLESVVSNRTGLSQAEAVKRVDETSTRYRALRAEAEAKIRDAAEKARRTTVIAAFLAAAVSLAGLVAAAWAAGVGGSHRVDSSRFRAFGRERFW